MRNLKATLKKRLRDVRRLALLGVGSELRADDAAGLLVAKRLEERCGVAVSSCEVKVFYGATAPENITGEIKKFRPTHLVVVDSADAGERPGAVTLIEPEDEGGVSFSTHRLPVRLVTGYLGKFLECEMIVIGIKPKTLDFFRRPSPEVRTAVRSVSNAIEEAIREVSK
jgi:hydrogenase 3 maturation protease